MSRLSFAAIAIASVTTSAEATQPTELSASPPVHRLKDFQRPAVTIQEWLAQDSQSEEEEEITVTGEQNRYRPPTSSTGTRLDVPQRDVPLSIQVIPREVIQDRGVVRLEDLAENVSGVQAERGYGGLSSQGYRIRGFITNFETLRNGFPDYGYFSPRDVANIERVEFLKGPGAVLYGGSPTQFSGGSGVVNTVTKKPLSTPYYNIDATYGSYNFVRPTIDFSGPLTSDRSVRYRLNAAYESADSFRDFVRNESFFVSPVIEWNLSDRTKLTLEYEHQAYNLKFDQGLPIEPESLQLPRSRFVGEPGFSNGNVSFNSFTYVLDHAFSDTVKFRHGLNYLTSDLRNARQAFSAGLRDDRRTIDRFFSSSEEEHGNLTIQNQLSFKFNTGSVRHTFLVGVDYARNSCNYLFAPDRELPIDIFNPQYGGIPTLVDGGEPFGRNITSNTVGIFAQNFVELLPNLKLLVGGRLDFNQYKIEDSAINETLNEQSVTRFSPRVGLVYQPSDRTSLFFNWGNGFSPQFQARSRTDELFDPQTTQQIEFGIKQDLIKDRLGATLAFYQIQKQNVLTADPEDSRFSIQTGEQRSRGIELDLAGEISRGWNVIATYAYTDAIVTKDNQIPVGDRIFGVPQHSASLWTTYRFQRGSLRGLGLGIGITYLSEQEADLPNSFTLQTRCHLESISNRDHAGARIGATNDWNSLPR